MNNLTLGWEDAILDLAELLATLPGPLFFVGGAVRDALLRRPVTDIDVLAPEGGIKLARRAANLLHADVYVLDEARDVARVILDRPEGRLFIDFSGLRAPDLMADLADRDFTFNAMAVNIHDDVQAIIDPLGGGPDLVGRRMVLCSPVALENDPVRVLRGLRQSVQFKLHMMPKTLAAMKAAAPRLAEASRERVRDEIVKMLSLDRAPTAVRVGEAIGVFRHVLPEAAALAGIKHAVNGPDGWSHALMVLEAMNAILHTISTKRTDDTAAQFHLGMIVVGFDLFRRQLIGHIERMGADDRPRQAMLLLAALLHDCGKAAIAPAGEAGQRIIYPDHSAAGADLAFARMTALRFSTQERKLVSTMVRHHADRTLWAESLAPLDIYRFWRTLGEDGIDVLLLGLADYLGQGNTEFRQAQWLHLVENGQLLLSGYFNQRERLVDPPPLVDGTELMERFGLKPSPLLGELLEYVRECQVAEGVDSKELAFGAAARYLAERPA